MRKKSLSEINSYLKNNTSLVLLSTEYLSDGKSFEVMCSCGECFSTYWKIIRNGKKHCNKCSYKKSQDFRRQTIDDVKEWLGANSTSKLLSTSYSSCKMPLELLCNCGEKYTATFDDLKNKNRTLKKVCPKCQLNQLTSRETKDSDLFLTQVNKLVGNDYTFLEEYVHAKHKLRVRHNLCGTVYQSSPDNFVNKGRRCPECFDNKNSKWSYEVEKFLKENGIDYLKEYSFPDCVHKRPLKFDFAVLNESGKLKGLIEVDGQQHFEPFRFIQDLELRQQKFVEGKVRDKIKDDYCKTKGIKLIRIPYFRINELSELLQDMLIPNQAV